MGRRHAGNAGRAVLLVSIRVVGVVDRQDQTLRDAPMTVIDRRDGNLRVS